MRLDDSHLSYVGYLNEALREDVAARESELQDLRNSLRCRVGGVVLEGFPPGLRSLKACVKLVRVYRGRRRAPQAKLTTLPVINDEALQVDTVVLGSSNPECSMSSDYWLCDDADLVAQRLDIGLAGTLVVRQPASVVARRLARARQNGWKIIWWPERDACDFDPALVEYVMAQADECREGAGT